jgi:hypothetical protein
VDDRSRYCVIARVVERANGRAICLAFMEALERNGAPEEVLTDNEQQFTGRFSRGGEVLFDKLCRRNGITHRLTPAVLADHDGKDRALPSDAAARAARQSRGRSHRPLEAQAALDDWVRDDNADRPHQSLELRAPVTPAERFRPAPDEQRELLPLWLPGTLASVPSPPATAPAERAVGAGTGEVIEGGPVAFERAIPSSGNRGAMGPQFWLGPHPAGQTVRLCASVDVIHLTIAGARVKSLRSHLSAAALAQLAQEGAVAAGPPPLPLEADGAAIEVDRVNKGGIDSLAGRQVLAAEILGGRPVVIRIEPQTLMFLDPDTRDLLPRAARRGAPARGSKPLRGARPQAGLSTRTDPVVPRSASAVHPRVLRPPLS